TRSGNAREGGALVVLRGAGLFDSSDEQGAPALEPAPLRVELDREQVSRLHATVRVAHERVEPVANVCAAVRLEQATIAQQIEGVGAELALVGRPQGGTLGRRPPDGNLLRRQVTVPAPVAERP